MCKNVFCTRYETLLLTEKKCVTTRDFKKTLVAIWYSWITLWYQRLLEKFFSFSFDWLHESKVFQDQNFHTKIYPYYPLCHMPLSKSKKEFFVTQKSLWVLKLLKALIDRVVFRFLSDRVLLQVLFQSSVIGCSSGSSVIDSSLGSSVLFFQYAAIFL